MTDRLETLATGLVMVVMVLASVILIIFFVALLASGAKAILQ